MKQNEHQPHPIIITNVPLDSTNKNKEFYPIHPVHVTSAKPSIENQFEFWPDGKVFKMLD